MWLDHSPGSACAEVLGSPCLSFRGHERCPSSRNAWLLVSQSALLFSRSDRLVASCQRVTQPEVFHRPDKWDEWLVTGLYPSKPPLSAPSGARPAGWRRPPLPRSASGIPVGRAGGRAVA